MTSRETPSPGSLSSGLCSEAGAPPVPTTAVPAAAVPTAAVAGAAPRASAAPVGAAGSPLGDLAWTAWAVMRLQGQVAVRRALQVPHLAALAALTLSALYLSNLLWVVPWIAGALLGPFERAESAYGAGLFYVALLHLAAALLPVAAYFSQTAAILDTSVPLRVVHRRARSPRAVAAALVAECLALMLLVELLLFPVLWQPFLAELEGWQLARLVGFRAITFAAVLALVVALLAFRHRQRGRGGSIAARWLAVLGYYGLLLGSGFWVSRTFEAPTEDHLLVRSLSLLNALVAGDSTLTRIALLAGLWGVALPLASLGLARSLHRYGI
ncbi:MAG: hypothetical protein MI919_04295 [Holophagales bacterium]|nr:hypothetical protein [Holophagales bacterium]